MMSCDMSCAANGVLSKHLIILAWVYLTMVLAFIVLFNYQQY